MNSPRIAVALISGGLDSLLAARLLLEQGIHVEGINFFTGFCVEGHTHAIRKHEGAKPQRNKAQWVAEQLGIKLLNNNIVDENKNKKKNPRHGYGAHLNPCLDCKGFMVGQAHRWMEEHGFDFIITGEVLGQRPMSQRRDTFPIIARESGAGDRLLRPLCEQLLPPTLPELEGWVDREKLLGFNGRSRKPQMALAAEFDIQEYAQPAGGCCFLTDPNYTRKLQDLWQTRGDKKYELDDIMLLKVGRRQRPRLLFFLFFGCVEGENNFLEGYRWRYTLLRPMCHHGSFAIVDGALNLEGDVELAARLLARFSQGRDTQSVRIRVGELDGASYEVDVTPMSTDEIAQEWYL